MDEVAFIQINPAGNAASSMAPISWVVAVGIAAAFMLGFTMGANDVANAFGTTVGAKILTMKQALVVAAVFDVAGSMTLGVGVAKTIASKIIDVSIYEDEPAL
jgi:sodium-dependent phosphate transporter